MLGARAADASAALSPPHAEDVWPPSGGGRLCPPTAPRFRGHHIRFLDMNLFLNTYYPKILPRAHFLQ